MREKAGKRHYEFIVSYLYCDSAPLAEQLASAGYGRIAECAWEKEGI